MLNTNAHDVLRMLINTVISFIPTSDVNLSAPCHVCISFELPLAAKLLVLHEREDRWYLAWRGVFLPNVQSQTIYLDTP